jgi:hypothetical protein
LTVRARLPSWCPVGYRDLHGRAIQPGVLLEHFSHPGFDHPSASSCHDAAANNPPPPDLPP